MMTGEIPCLRFFVVCSCLVEYFDFLSFPYAAGTFHNDLLTRLKAAEHFDQVSLRQARGYDPLLGLGDLLVDAAQGAPGPVVLVLVVGDPVAAAPDLVLTRAM